MKSLLNRYRTGIIFTFLITLTGCGIILEPEEAPPPPKNIKPSAIIASMEVPTGTALLLDGSKSFDPEGNSLSYSWTLLSKPTGSKTVLKDPSSASTSLNLDEPGKYCVQLIVKDWQLNSAPMIFKIYALPVSTSKIPDTGQQCYDNSGVKIDCPSPGEEFYGQDGSYRYQNSPSYTKLDSSGKKLPYSAKSWVMVKDNVTGLIWEVKANCESEESINSKLDEYTWQGAQDEFIAKLNAQNFGGYSDWRLPTVNELAYLIYHRKKDIYIDTDYFPNTMPSYWTSTPNSWNTYGAWHVSFKGNYINTYNKSSWKSVRAVRGGK